MKIEEGKCYKTMSGHKTEPLEKCENGPAWIANVVDCNGDISPNRIWRLDGSSYGNDCFNLVAEWTEPEIDPGEGYRLLKKGEIIHIDDEVLGMDGVWRRGADTGDPHDPVRGTFRRKLPPPAKEVSNHLSNLLAIHEGNKAHCVTLRDLAIMSEDRSILVETLDRAPGARVLLTSQGQLELKGEIFGYLKSAPLTEENSANIRRCLAALEGMK